MSNKKVNRENSKGPDPDEANLDAVGKPFPQKKTLDKDTDTEPDEFIGHDADTDEPVDRQILNDSVLRGEANAADKQLLDENYPPVEKKGPKKMDAEKS